MDRKAKIIQRASAVVITVQYLPLELEPQIKIQLESTQCVCYIFAGYFEQLFQLDFLIN